MQSLTRAALATFLVFAVGLSVRLGSRAVQTWSEPGVSTVNLHVRQASAFVHGHAALDGPALDAAQFEGRWYDPFPPAPAVLFAPIVAIAGPRPYIATTMCLLLTIVGVAALRRILRQLSIPSRDEPWLLLAFFLGSGYWYVVSYSEGVWFSAAVVSVVAVLLAIDEALTGRRAWLAGAWLAVAVLSRQVTIFLAPAVIVIALEDRPRDRLRWIARFAAPLAGAVAAYLVFNQLRFGSPWETGYRYMPVDGYEAARLQRFGLFSLAYVPVNLFHLLLHGFSVSFSSPDRLTSPTPDWFGTSILAASPFIVAALFAPRSLRTTAIWLTAAAMILVQAAYYVSGAGQLNWQRYALDYWPLLFVLIALGYTSEVERGHARLWNGTIAYAVGVNALVLAYFGVFAWFLDRWTRFFAR